MDLTINRR